MLIKESAFQHKAKLERFPVLDNEAINYAARREEGGKLKND